MGTASSHQSTAGSSSKDSADPADKFKVSREAENKIIYKLSLIGVQRCSAEIEEFNKCCKGRTFTQVGCKGLYDKSQECMHRYVNQPNIDMVTQRWVDDGMQRKPNWDVLLQGVDNKA